MRTLLTGAAMRTLEPLPVLRCDALLPTLLTDRSLFMLPTTSTSACISQLGKQPGSSNKHTHTRTHLLSLRADIGRGSPPSLPWIAA